jgi:hypothetical protein
MKLTTVSLKNHPTIKEKWVQEQIATDPTILGLGPLVVREKERIQPNAGRLDLLLQDVETLKRFECEVQLGTTDETHIIRTIEYWDIERRRYPQYKHAAVLIAEGITGRFLNVIHLFNGHIPLIVIKMTAYQVGNEIALTFTKILDEMSFGLIDEDEPIPLPADRNYWEKLSSKQVLTFTDSLLKIIQDVAPNVSLKYTKSYIGLCQDGVASNFCTFNPRKNFVIMNFKITQSDEVSSKIEQAGMETLAYDSQWRLYRLKLSKLEEEDIPIIKDLANLAFVEYMKPMHYPQ